MEEKPLFTKIWWLFIGLLSCPSAAGSVVAAATGSAVMHCAVGIAFSCSSASFSAPCALVLETRFLSQDIFLSCQRLPEIEGSKIRDAGVEEPREGLKGTVCLSNHLI